MRLFIAVKLPAEIINELQEIVDKIQKDFPYKDARFTTPEQWHLTLVFLGGQPETAVDGIKKALKSAAVASRKIKVGFESITYGPAPSGARLAPLERPPRMIWLNAVPETSRNLTGLKEIIEKELKKEKIDWPIENRPFHGHLTLARFLPRLKNSLSVLEVSFNKVFIADRIYLMQSRLKPSGAVYEEIENFALMG